MNCGSSRDATIPFFTSHHHCRTRRVILIEFGISLTFHLAVSSRSRRLRRRIVGYQGSDERREQQTLLVRIGAVILGKQGIESNSICFEWQTIHSLLDLNMISIFFILDDERKHRIPSAEFHFSVFDKFAPCHNRPFEAIVDRENSRSVIGRQV